MFNLKYLSSLLCILLFCGSLSAQTEIELLKPQKNELILTLKKSDSHGQSPVYNLSLQPNGEIFFEGISMTKVKGKVEDTLNQTEINKLVEEIIRTDFFSLKDFYTYESKNCHSIMLDSPTIILSINLNGKEKTITHYLGCLGENESTSFLQQLYDLEDKIDEIVETKRWIGERK